MPSGRLTATPELMLPGKCNLDTLSFPAQLPGIVVAFLLAIKAREIIAVSYSVCFSR